MDRSAESSDRSARHNPPAPVILQVLPALGAGGVERGTVDVARAIVEAGGTALVAARGGRLVEELRSAGALHLDLPVDTKNPIAMARNVTRLQAVIQSHGVDLVHARSRAPAWSALAAARGARIPFVTTFHGLYGSKGILKRRYNSIMTRGDRVIAVSHFVADHVRRVYRADASRIRVIPRGVDLQAFDPDAVTPDRVAALRREWDVPDDRRVLLLPGRLSEWKGQMALLTAATRLARKDVRIVLAGPAAKRGDFRRRVVEKADALGLGSVLRITGDVHDMPAAYAAADVVVNASTSPEAFGRVMAEALAMRRPVVAFDHGAAPEIVEHGRTGWLVPPGDIPELARAIAGALDLDRSRWRWMGEAGRRRIIDDFGKDAMTERTLQLYEELLSRPFPQRSRD